MNKTPSMFMLGNSGSTVLDPSFPRIAAKAALELDGALQRVLGKRAPAEFQSVAVSILLPVLRRFFQAAMEKRPLTSVDPASANVFFTAYLQVDPKAVKHHALEKQKVAKGAERVVAVLEKVGNQQLPESKKDLEFTRDLCVALSDTAAVRQHIPHSTPQGLRRGL